MYTELTSEEISKVIKIEPLTKVRTILPDIKDKPLPRKPLLTPPDIDPCPFCLLASQLPSPTLTDKFGPRPLLASNDSSYLIPNHWPILSSLEGTSLLAIPLEHVVAFEDLQLQALAPFMDLIQTAYHSHLPDSTKLAFLNIGIGAGGSVPHLHAQLVSAPIPATDILTTLNNPQAVKADLLAAIQQTLTLNLNSSLTANTIDLNHFNPTTPIAYLPATMSRGLEIRLVGGAVLDRALLTQKTLKALKTLIGDFNYNLTWFFESDLTEILVTLDYGLIYPRYFNLNLQLTDSQALAHNLSNALSEI